MTEGPSGLGDLGGILRRRLAEPAPGDVPAPQPAADDETTVIPPQPEPGVLTRAELRKARQAGADADPAFPAAAQAAPEASVPAPSAWSEQPPQKPSHRQESDTMNDSSAPIPWQTVPVAAPPPTRRKRKRRAGAVITGVVGELLITMGCILGLYVVWELVWTTVEAKAYATGVVDDEIKTRSDWVNPDADSPFAAKHTEAPPKSVTDMATPAFGEAWATLHVPAWGSDYNVPIVEGTDRKKILNKGLIGHYPESTTTVGELGNFATAAHRTTYGAPYNKVQELSLGDLVIVETPGYYFVFAVTGTEIVYPNEVRVVWPVPNQKDATPTKALYTLTTCHPKYSAKQRFVVWSELQYWTDKKDGPLEDLAGQKG
jgi:sortase A